MPARAQVPATPSTYCMSVYDIIKLLCHDEIVRNEIESVGRDVGRNLRQRGRGNNVKRTTLNLDKFGQVQTLPRLFCTLLISLHVNSPSPGTQSRSAARTTSMTASISPCRSFYRAPYPFSSC